MRYIILALLALVGYALFRTLTKPRADAPTARRETENLGLEVSEVSRALPVAAIGGRSYRLVDGKCARYRLPNHAPGAPRFELLQRAGTGADASADADARVGTLAPGWQLVVHQGEVGPALRAELERITKEWTEDFLELEGDDQGISAFWNEGRGQTAVWQVHGYLKAIAEAVR
jgi:hypothetical protein